MLRGDFEHQRRVQFEGCSAEPLQTITTILPGSKWSCMLLRIVLRDALSEVVKVVPQTKSCGCLWTTSQLGWKAGTKNFQRSLRRK